MANEIKNAILGFGRKKTVLLIICMIVGIALISIGSGSFGTSNEDKEYDTGNGVYYSEILEEKLEDFLRTVGGIESAEVFITVDGSKEFEYAQKGGDDSYAVDYLIVNNENGEEPAMIREIYPKIRGVAVSCTDGEKAVVKEKITTLISAGLGISSNKIKVVGN